MLSKPAQEIYTEKLGYVSMRKDVVAEDVPTKKLYLSLRPNFATEYQHWRKLADTILRKR